MTARIMDDNGYMTVKNNPISRAGVFPYLGKHIPGAPDPAKIYNVLRPAEELADPECQESFRHLPIIDDHVELNGELTTDANGDVMAPEDKGVHGITGEAIDFRDNVLYSNIRIYSRALKDRLRSGKKGLSLGYRCQYENSPGTFDGQAYDYVQRSLRGNHLALVDKPRNDVYVLDGMTFDSFDLSLNKEETTKMVDIVADPAAQAVETPPVTLETLAAQVGQLAEAVKAVSEKVESMTAGAEEVVEEAAAVGEEAEAVKEGAEEVVEDEGDKAKKPVDEKKVTAMDSAIKSLSKEISTLKKDGIKSLMGEISKRDALVGKLTPFVGTFDHAEMTHDEVAAYGVKKLGLQCAKGQESSALSGYLHGRTPQSQSSVATFDAQDPNKKSQISAFIAGKSN